MAAAASLAVPTMHPSQLFCLGGSAMVRNRLVIGLVYFLAILIAGCASATPAPEPTALPTQAPPTAPAATLPALEPTTVSAGLAARGRPPPGRRTGGQPGAVQGERAARRPGSPQRRRRNDDFRQRRPPDPARWPVGGGSIALVVDLTTLHTDNNRRDGYIQRNTLETGTYPEAVFVPTAAAGLPSPLPDSGPVAFQLSGDLTVHGVTRPVTWEVTAEIAGQSLSGTATTSITFTDFGMTLPRVGPVLSVEDLIALELDFVLTIE